LPLCEFFLLADVLPSLRLIQPDRTHTVPYGPEVPPGHPSLLQQFAMTAHGTLPFQLPQRVRHAVLGRNAQTPMEMIGHTVSFDQLNSFLPTPLAQNRANLSP
jgi:hypothetical protein